MNFNYSSFISYRRNVGDEKFVKNFKDIIESEAQKVTNISKVFFDEKSIIWGNEFDEKIYDGITSSYFFISIYHNSYLHIDNVWCAREIYHAIEIEKKIRETYSDFCFILPIIHRGSANDLPKCVEQKNAKVIRLFEHAIINKKVPNKLIEFIHNIYDVLLINFQLIEAANLNLKVLCSDIHIPSDEEIKVWIEKQKGIQRKQESENLPILKKNV
jgi:hypothetical protein